MNDASPERARPRVTAPTSERRSRPPSNSTAGNFTCTVTGCWAPQRCQDLVQETFLRAWQSVTASKAARRFVPGCTDRDELHVSTAAAQLSPQDGLAGSPADFLVESVRFGPYPDVLLDEVAAVLMAL